MSGRRKTRDNVSINLFPFLAVLICTMGALIVLLVVMVQQARVRAHEPVVARQPQDERQLAELQRARQQRIAEHERRKSLAEQNQQQIDEYQWQTELLTTSYEKTVEQLAEQRLALSHLESHTRQLSEQAALMQSEADIMANAATDDAADRDSQRTDLEQLKVQLVSARREVERAKEELSQRPTKHVLVPYDGPNGTQRPPIYIECFADRVILRPENVVLYGEDFREPLASINPLAMALRAKREFLLEHGLLAGGSEPYPLLVVRPGSAASYSAARAAMRAWESEFGYELVEADIELDYRTADPRLTRLLDDVVSDARERRRLMRSMRTSRSGRRELLRPAPDGGFESVPNGQSSFVGRRNSDAEHFASEGDGHGFASQSSGDGGFETGGQPVDRPSRFESEDFGSGGSVRGGAPDGQGIETANSGRGSTAGVAGPGGDFDEGTANAADSGGGGSSTTASGAGGSGTSGGGGQSTSPSGESTSGNSFQTTQSLSQSRGKNWALPLSQVDAVGIKRPIHVVCDDERIWLVPERGTRQEVQIFRHDGSISAVVDPFVDAVRARLDSWGIAGRGIYWRPVLQVQIRDQGLGSYRQLWQLLEDSGIEVTREP